MMVRGREIESEDEEEERKIDEGELLDRNYGCILEYLLYYFTFHGLGYDKSIVQSRRGILGNGQ